MGASLAAPLPKREESPRAAPAFVAKGTKAGAPDFVPAPGRSAVLDNDATLRCERPTDVQAVFARDRGEALAPAHPEWKERPPFMDRAALADIAHQGLLDVVAASHPGMTSDAFAAVVRDRTSASRHPRFELSAMR